MVNVELMLAMRNARKSRHSAWQPFINGNTSVCRCGWKCKPGKGCRD